MEYWYSDFGERGPIRILSDEILHFYWKAWSSEMMRRTKPKEEITWENCIDEWIVVNWAWKCDEFEWRICMNKKFFKDVEMSLFKEICDNFSNDVGEEVWQKLRHPLWNQLMGEYRSCVNNFLDKKYQ